MIMQCATPSPLYRSDLPSQLGSPQRRSNIKGGPISRLSDNPAHHVGHRSRSYEQITDGRFAFDHNHGPKSFESSPSQVNV
ncbi:hypothetical protein M413DRAFT_268173 [Hebeloma cylindrosporum]|uniref:Uncharacterized protein n=1 Tax=Hebeloma cylindrosporum TaxID=76867 RepID=A0A0C2Z1G5_HEBCY|nr:hypothetical protein M413DRAFT_268173 [Hebeloma cylindrosporum h7]